MANNPIVHNNGGIFRFQDYLSQVPGFLKSEDDVVSILQLFSDYINNAYRNISSTQEFEFKLVTTESRLGITIKKLQKLVNIFKQSYDRSLKVLYLSKPITNPLNSYSYCIGVFDYDGSPDDLSPNIINSEIPKIDGDRAFIRFTDSQYSSHTNMYIYNAVNDTLTPDPYGSSQDPFLNTPNELLETVGGLAPRMLEFSVSNISDIKVRKAKTVGTLIYFEVFFTVHINDVENIESIVPIDTTSKYLIDYYDSLELLSSSYRYKYNIEFGSDCKSFDWTGNGEEGNGLFYARELTQYGKEMQFKGKLDTNKYIDPLFSDNTSTLTISQITGDGAETYSTVTVKTLYPHGLDVGEDFNIENAISTSPPLSFNGIGFEVKEIVNSLEFTFLFDAEISGTLYVGNVVLTNLFYNKKRNNPNSFTLKLFYKNLEGLIEFKANDIIARVEENDETATAVYDASTVDINSDYIYVDDELGLPADEWKNNDKITMRRKLDYSGDVTIPGGLVEGDLYDISLPHEGTIKLEDADITSVGEGKFEIVNLKWYFDATSDVDLAKNTIKIHHAYEDREENPIDPLADLEVGDSIRFNGVRPSIIDLPTPLYENVTYKILEIDSENNTIKLTEDGTTEINITIAGTGIIDVFKLVIVTSNTAKIDTVTITDPNDEGVLLLKSHTGDFISEGEIAKLTYGKIDFIADIDSTSVVWEKVTGNMYKKGSFVTYQNIRYKLINSVTINYNSLTPNIDITNYQKDMDNIIIWNKTLEENPYMFGLFAAKSLKIDETPNFDAGFSELSKYLYIRKLEDLELKYGHDQREWVFSPRFAPKDVIKRNGFIEIIKNEVSGEDILDDTLVAKYSKATTAYCMLLEELDLKTEKTIQSLYYDSTTNLIIGTVDTTAQGNHRLKTGVRIRISGANQAGYNGIFTVNVVDQTTISYTPTTVPIVTPATGTIKLHFKNEVIHEIEEINLDSYPTVEVTTTTPHGFRSGIDISIEDNSSTETYEGITVTGVYSFQFDAMAVPSFTLPACASYQPIDGDYIIVEDQVNTEDDGTYIARESKWEKYETSKITSKAVIFTRQNIFDTTENNPSIAQGSSLAIKSMILSENTVTVNLSQAHDYRIGTIVNIKNARQSEYNGRFYVSNVDEANHYQFQYKIKSDQTPASPAIPLEHKNLTCQSDKWYKFSIDETQWQQKSNAFTFAVSEDNTEYNIYGEAGYEFTNNVSTLAGEYKFTYNPNTDPEYYDFKEGDIVNTYDQIIPSENAKYRVAKGRWQILNKKWVAKITNITVDSLEGSSDPEANDPMLYVVYDDDQVDDYMNDNFSGNLQVYKIDNLFVNNFEFVYERVENLDTTSSYHKLYNAKYDKNSVVLDRTDMDSDFVGVPDMEYPLVEKIERLAYLKDPNVLDFEFISYLARYMGYDITSLLDDVSESEFYTTDKEREMAVRKSIQNLPQFYALKSTKSGLEAILLAFGIVGKVVTMWTEASNPYDDFIPDYLVRENQYTQMMDGKSLNLVTTPHFKLRVDIAGNFENQLDRREMERLKVNITKYKPINTVFDGIIAYINLDLSANIFMGEMNATGRMQADIGFDDLEFSYGSLLNNDCLS